MERSNDGFRGSHNRAYPGELLQRLYFPVHLRKSVVFPPSHCPHCLHRLAWYEILPVLSYLCLRGRCSYCGVRISLQYTLVELLSGSVAGVIVWRFGLGPDFAVYLIAAGVLIVASGIDARIGILPDVLLVSATLLAIPASDLVLGHGWLAPSPAACWAEARSGSCPSSTDVFVAGTVSAWETPSLCVCSAPWLAPWHSPQSCSWVSYSR